MAGRTNKELAALTEEKLGIRIFSHEYQILVALHDHDRLTVGQMAAEMRVSPSTFQSKLKNLVLSGLVVWEADRADCRRRRYRLSDYARDVLDEELRFLSIWNPASRNDSYRMDVMTLVRRMEALLKMRMFSYEYQLILIVYDNGPTHTIDLHSRSGMPSRSFHNTLQRLVNRGLIFKTDDESDQRRKRNCLPDWARATLDEIHRELRQWSNSLSGR